MGKKIQAARSMVASNKTKLAKELGIARSSLYYQPRQSIKDELVKQAIITVMNANRAYGHKRIALELGMNKKKVLRVMKKYHLKPQKRRKSRPEKPEDQGKESSITLNLAKKICPLRPNVFWAGDFTYLPWQQDFIYLATVMDVFNREVIGWHLGRKHTTTLVIEALLSALQVSTIKPITFHSDQGSEYVSTAYKKILTQLDIRPSCSSKASPWENPYQESFYSNFKLELGTLARFNDLGELTEAIAQQIYYYNNNRIHTSLKMSPRDFKKQHYLKTKTTAQMAVVTNNYSLIESPKSV